MKGQTMESVFSHNEKSLAAMLQTAMHVGAYEPPRTVRTVVETEGNFCGSIVPDEPDMEKKNIYIEAQEFGVKTNYDVDPNTGQQVEGGGWDF